VEDIISVQNVDYVYKSHSHDSHETKALLDINLNFNKGQFIVVLGRNGSGKSTFSRLLNALLIPTNGLVLIKGIDTKDDKNLWEIRRSAGMVFQNPDNQIIGTIVEEDVAFGPENIGVRSEEIRTRVDNALKLVGISELTKHAPHLLSGGQKQRVAIAGILAMKPECIILDEATSMLDPVGRKEVMSVLRKLNVEEKITIIHITHHMDEATLADKVIVFNEGKVAMAGSPKQIFSNVEKIKGLGLDVPQVSELLYELNKEGFNLPHDILSVEEAFEALKKKLL
jgi:energy-coupling factor transport system ATP-binding protein